MKKTYLILTLILMSGAINVFAAPELVAVKGRSNTQKEKDFQDFLSRFPVQQVRDPATRQALAALRDYLNPAEQVRQEREEVHQKMMRKKQRESLHVNSMPDSPQVQTA